MPDTTLLLPFSLPPAEHAKDLLAPLDAPALARLLARAQPGRRLDSEPFAAALPHEALLAGSAADNSPPVAHALMHKLGLAPADGHWFVLQPVHFHVARDHLVLTDPRQLAIDALEAQALFDAVQLLFDELGHELRFGNARYWFLRADAWADLRTCTPGAAAGHNVDIWLPRGTGERDWRRLHNEVQMLWHLHPLNEHRDTRGRARINALWLWGGGAAGTFVPDDYLHGLADVPAVSEQHRTSGWVVDDTLMASALAGDWGSWLAAMQAIDRHRLVPLLDALQSGALSRITLLLTDAQRVREWQVSRGCMRKFWRRPSLSRLAE